MPFGAALQPDGGVRFALWAPAARSVALRLEARGAHSDHPMEPAGDGWHRLATDRAGAGDRYRFVIDGASTVPDPASRFQPDGVHAASAVVDPRGFDWPGDGWRGRPWEEAVIYELHVGTFTPAGTYRAAIERLDHVVALGATAIELMPLGECPGDRNWGYDGAYPFAPEQRYGTPDELKQLVAAAQARGLMVLLDVVYNHFGPEGNYLARYAPGFFTDRHQTPWGAALDFDGPGVAAVRAFFRHNALYWLEEYRLDGLRLDAVHAIRDDGPKHILAEIAEAVQALGLGRPVHLVLENDDNDARWLERGDGDRPRFYAAQWNDDVHHALHAALTGEAHSYYRDCADDPVRHLARALAEGFAFQGEYSAHRGRARGGASAHLPAAAFVNFIQNHDQIGNRPGGERIAALAPAPALRAALAILLLCPAPPLLFMGEEWGSTQPFCFFCDFDPELAEAVRQGRAREFAELFGEAKGRAAVAASDATSEATFRRSVLSWDDLDEPGHRDWLEYYRFLLDLRRRVITPRIAGARGLDWTTAGAPARALRVRWRLADGAVLGVTANLSGEPTTAIAPPPADGRLFQTGDPARTAPIDELPGWSVFWSLAAPGR